MSILISLVTPCLSILEYIERKPRKTENGKFRKGLYDESFCFLLLNLWYIYWKGTAWTWICPDLLQRWKMAKFVQTFFKVNRRLWGIQTSCSKVIRRNKDRWLLLPAQNTKHGILKTKTQNTKIMLQIHCYIVFPHNISIASPGALIDIPRPTNGRSSFSDHTSPQ